MKRYLKDQNLMITLLAAFGITVVNTIILSVLTKILISIFYNLGLTILISIIIFIVSFLTISKRGFKYE